MDFNCTRQPGQKDELSFKQWDVTDGNLFLPVPEVEKVKIPALGAAACAKGCLLRVLTGRDRDPI